MRVNESFNPYYEEFKLEWGEPGKGYNTFIALNFTTIVNFIKEKNIKSPYNIKGWINNKWENIISEI